MKNSTKSNWLNSEKEDIDLCCKTETLGNVSQLGNMATWCDLDNS